ncbi:MAG: toll/interleukin-1 receptor domain-containing protein [Candidatus Competibacter sp.]
MDSNIFISFSHKDKSYRDELVPALEAVAAIRDRVWFDQKSVGIGDKFHPEIQRALAESRIGILLVSNHFLTSEYIKTHELPFLLRQAERGALKLGILHVSTVAKAALAVAIEIDGRPRTVNLADTIGVNSPTEPLDRMSPGERNALYARAADWAVRQMALEEPPPPPSPPPSQDPAVSPDSLPEPPFSGKAKIAACDHLSDSWRKLADYFEITPADRARFERGDEACGIWEWLENRRRLGELPRGLIAAGRKDVVALLKIKA